MAGDRTQPCELDQEKYDADDNVKIICLGDSAVGKSKLMERFLMNGLYPSSLEMPLVPATLPTLMHLHLLHQGRVVFDVQRKVTYKNLSTWYAELREFRPEIPCIVVANKIDADINVTQKSFNFARKFSLPLYFVSAADGTNVVKLFNDAIRLAVSYKQNSQDFMDEVLQELENFKLEQKEEDAPNQDQSSRIENPSPS
ncbi:rab-like protein 2B isoform X4 [Ictidomys tridecemlineatus]